MDREQRKAEAKASWARKTPEEQKASRQRLFQEQLDQICDHIYKIVKESIGKQWADQDRDDNWWKTGGQMPWPPPRI
jgi:acyl-CoA reductase-like NAD-dependent aldehyde dehydrogenase